MNFFLTRWFHTLLQWIFDLLNNDYFVTILIVTLFLRIIQIFPDISNRKMQIKSAAIQPELDVLKKRYSNDPQKLQQEQAKLMKKNGISMWSSCLPMLITLPIFFCFLNAFRCWGNEETVILMYETAVAEDTQSAEDMERAQNTFDSFDFLWMQNIWQPDSMFAPVVSQPNTLMALNSEYISRMPLFENGYTTADGIEVSGPDIWAKLCDFGLASGDYGDGGKGSSCAGCSGCSTDRSGMALLPDVVSDAAADRYLSLYVEDSSVDETPSGDSTTPAVTADATEALDVESTVSATADADATVEATETVDSVAQAAGITGSDIYKATMQRYVDQVAGGGPERANGIFILPILAAGMQVVTMLLSQKRMNKASGGASQNSSNKMMLFLMPIISIMVCISSTAAFALYWALSGVFQLISTIVINAIFDKRAKKNIEVI